MREFLLDVLVLEQKEPLRLKVYGTLEDMCIRDAELFEVNETEIVPYDFDSITWRNVKLDSTDYANHILEMLCSNNRNVFAYHLSDEIKSYISKLHSNSVFIKNTLFPKQIPHYNTYEFDMYELDLITTTHAYYLYDENVMCLDYGKEVLSDNHLAENAYIADICNCDEYKLYMSENAKLVAKENNIVI